MNEREIRKLIDQGEGVRVEFKEAVPRRLADLAIVACAFANTEGGTILLGVTDNGAIVGCEIGNAQRAEIHSALQAMLPPLRIPMSPILVDNALIWALEVPEGTEKPYTVSGAIYRREGASCQKTVDPHHMRKLFYASEEAPSWDSRTSDEVELRQNLNHEVFKDFRLAANFSPSLPDGQIIDNLRLYGADGNPKRGAVLFFCDHAERLNVCALVQCVLFKGMDRVNILDTKEFYGPLPLQYSQTMRWLKQVLKVQLVIGGGPHHEVWEIPEPALKEAVVNALVHRDYAEQGAMIQVHIFDDRIEIANPGGLPPDVAENFGSKSHSRNTVLFPLFRQMRLVERMGSGIPRIQLEMQTAGLPEPEFHHNGFFQVTLRRPEPYPGYFAEAHRLPPPKLT